MTEAKAIRNSVEGRDVPPYPHVDHDHATGQVRGPSATQLHDRAIRRCSFWVSGRQCSADVFAAGETRCAMHSARAYGRRL